MNPGDKIKVRLSDARGHPYNVDGVFVEDLVQVARVECNGMIFRVPMGDVHAVESGDARAEKKGKRK